MIPAIKEPFSSMSGMEELIVRLQHLSSVFYSKIQMFCPVHQSMEAAAKNIRVAGQAKSCMYIAIRACMHRRLLTKRQPPNGSRKSLTIGIILALRENVRPGHSSRKGSTIVPWQRR